MFGMSSSIRVGLPTAGDPTGRSGSGSWWLTGSARPAIGCDGAWVPRRRRGPLFWLRRRIR
jgi:hypothetical protein